MGRKRKQRRQAHGSAWCWKQTGCWYYTRPGTKKRVPLFGEDGQRIRGEENKEAAELARGGRAANQTGATAPRQEPTHHLSLNFVIDPCIANDRGRSPVPRRNPLEPRIDYAKINSKEISRDACESITAIIISAGRQSALGFVRTQFDL